MRVCPRCRSIYATQVPWCALDESRLIETDADPLVGQAVDRYQVDELLGVGGMGRVYRARHRVLEREYALKVLFGDYASQDRFMQRFRREAISASRVRHAHVVSVEDYGSTEEGLVFLAMEFVDGSTVADRIRQEGRLPPAEARHIAQQVALGLGAAHACGLVHRDIKPQNLMVDRHRQQTKILDFGAVNLAEQPEGHRLTTVGHIVGTPAYMAPEQSQNSDVGPAADFYSLGVVLFEMLTGKLPFEGRTRAELLVAHITQPAPPCPPADGLEHVVSALLEKRPDLRPDRAEQVLALLGFERPDSSPEPTQEVPVVQAFRTDPTAPSSRKTSDSDPMGEPTSVSYMGHAFEQPASTEADGILAEPPLEWLDPVSSILSGDSDSGVGTRNTEVQMPRSGAFEAATVFEPDGAPSIAPEPLDMALGAGGDTQESPVPLVRPVGPGSGTPGRSAGGIPSPLLSRQSVISPGDQDRATSTDRVPVYAGEARAPVPSAEPHRPSSESVRTTKPPVPGLGGPAAQPTVPVERARRPLPEPPELLTPAEIRAARGRPAYWPWLGWTLGAAAGAAALGYLMAQSGS